MSALRFGGQFERERQPMPRIGPWQGQLEQFLASNANKPSRERLTLILTHREVAPLLAADHF